MQSQEMRSVTPQEIGASLQLPTWFVHIPGYQIRRETWKNHRLAPANATVTFSLGKLLSCGGELCGKTCNKFVRKNRNPPNNYTIPFPQQCRTHHVTVLRLLGQRRRLFLQVLGAGVWLRLHGLQMQYRPQVMQQ